MKNLLILGLVIALASDSILWSAIFGIALYINIKLLSKSNTYEKEI